MGRLEDIENLEARIAVRLDEFGREVPDTQPVTMPAGFRRPETLAEQVQRLVRTQLSEHAANQGAETFEESEDFDVDDEFDPTSPYEEFFDPALNRSVSIDEFQRNAEVYKKRYLKAQEQMYAQMDAEGIIRDNLHRRRYRERQAKSGGVGVSPTPSSDPAKPATPSK